VNICIDVQPAMAQRAGVGRYTRALVEHLGEFRGSDAVRLFSFDFKRHGTPLAAPGLAQKRIRWCPGRFVQKCWKTIAWPPYDWLAGPADLYHFPNFIIPPLTTGKAVVTIHDVSFLRYPGFAESRNLAFLTARMSETIRRAEAVITDSRFSAREITDLLKVSPAKVAAIPLGISERMTRPGPDRVAEWRRAQGLDRPYLLTVGTLEPRKNHEFLIQVFERLGQFDGLLVIAGMRGWRYQPILDRMRRSPRAADIRYLDYVADEDLPALYAGAELFLFPSLYEGFGFPPLEAMACGTPVLASNAGSLEEVLGGGARLLGEFNLESWATEAWNLLTDTAARQAWIDKGLRQTALYRWQATARKTWELYRKVAQ
jgi:glycosyltransferase involved in cell wall biosynthesis